MNIGIIGTGNIASALGLRWAEAGHNILFGSREIDKANAAATKVGSGARAGSYQDAVDFGEVVVLAIPLTAAQELLGSLTGLSGKVVLETTNNFAPSDRSSTQQIMDAASGAKVVKAFNTVFAQIIAAPPSERSYRPDVFIAGDDADAKAKVTQLITDAGFDAFDVGDSASAHHLEKLAAFIIEMGYGHGMGTQINYKVAKVVK